jgi:hypothetical protein
MIFRELEFAGTGYGKISLGIFCEYPTVGKNKDKPEKKYASLVKTYHIQIRK